MADNKLTQNTCERCRQVFTNWPDYHAHRQVIRCSVRYVTPEAGHSGRTKADIVAHVEKLLKDFLTVPEDVSLHNFYLANKGANNEHAQA